MKINDGVIAASLVSLLFLGLAAGSMFSLDAQENQGYDYFVTTGSLQGNSYEYGFNERNSMDAPMRIRPMGTGSYARENFIMTDAQMGELWMPYAETALDSRQDVGVMPYQINMPRQYLGFYVAEDSDIQGPEDLDGKTVILPGATPPKIVDTSWMILEDQYGVDVKVLNRTHRGYYDADLPIQALNEGEADAAVITGNRRIEESEEVRPVYFPYKDLKDEYGAAVLPTFFLSETDPQSIEENTEMIEALNRSSAVAQSEPDRFMKKFRICNEYLVLDGRPHIERMTPESKTQLNYLMDLQVENGNMNEKFNITEEMIET